MTEEKPKVRPCMCCKKPFLSLGNFNRICKKCKNSPKFKERGLPVVTGLNIKFD